MLDVEADSVPLLDRGHGRFAVAPGRGDPEREAGGDKSRPVVLLCRSGKRTIPAGEALEAAGFAEVVTVLHGFEGELDEHFRRGRINGWRFENLPWEQL